MSVKGGMVDLRKRNAIRDHWLPKPFVLIGNDVGCVQQHKFWKARERTATVVSRYYCLSESCLMQPLFDGAQRVSSFHTVGWGS